MTYQIAQPGDDDCGACGAPDVAWPRCKECGATDIGYLHDQVKRDWTVTVRENSDGSWSAAA